MFEFSFPRRMALASALLLPAATASTAVSTIGGIRRIETI